MASGNRDIRLAWAYHDGTKHSPESIRANRHYMDWSNQPIPYKVIQNLEPIDLPQELRASGDPVFQSIAGGTPPGDAAQVDINMLAQLCFFSAGVTKQIKHGSHSMPFRAAACTGALYHIELYIACADVPGLSAGVYHFGAHDFSLRRLRAGDYRAALVDATGGEPSTAGAPAIFLFTTTYWRNSWKYQARAYRHSFWDSGTILANFLATAASNLVPANVVMGFADEPMNRLLGLNSEKEVTIALVPVGAGVPAGAVAPEIAPLDLTVMPLSARETDYPEIRKMHQASSLESGHEAKEWRRMKPVAKAATAPGKLITLPAPDLSSQTDSVERVILKRGSSRRFAQDPLTLAQLSQSLFAATRGIETDFLTPDSTTAELYLLVHAIEGLKSGAYYYHPKEHALELLQTGDYREMGGFLGLGQELPADAAVDIFFLTDLHHVLQGLGNRGYRAAQLEAAIRGGKLYLSAYAQGFGATGLTFFDDEVTAFFSPHAEGKSVMFLVALGVSAKRRQATAPVEFADKKKSA